MKISRTLYAIVAGPKPTVEAITGRPVAGKAGEAVLTTLDTLAQATQRVETMRQEVFHILAGKGDVSDAEINLWMAYRRTIRSVAVTAVGEG
jgi:hypothetical protein